MPARRFFVTVAVLTLVSISPSYAQNRKIPDRLFEEKDAPTRVQVTPSAIEQLYTNGIVPDLQFLPEDLAALPASFWPIGLSYDAQTGEVIFEGERLVVQEVPKASIRDREARTRANVSTTVVYVEEQVVTRMIFNESFVSENGDIRLYGPDGYIQLSTSDGGRFIVIVHPPVDDVDAFYPMTYFIEMDYLLAEHGSVACCASPGTGGGYVSCKCDTAGCGGGCDDTKCQGLKTCSGGCGSCAYTSCTECY